MVSKEAARGAADAARCVTGYGAATGGCGGWSTAAASLVAHPDNPFHVAGDWNSWKPIQSVSQLLHDGLKGQPIRHFHPPSHKTVYGH